jgi:DNA-binding beta-propeller fold protein YncE
LVQQLAFPPAGTIAQFTTAGKEVGTLATAGFGDIPESMTVLNGQLFVGDGAGRVNRIDLSTGNVASYFTTASFGLDSLGNYNGNLLTLEGAGTTSSSTVSVYSTAGALLQSITLASIPASNNWNGITSDGTTIYIADYASGRIYKYSSTGSLLGFIDTKLSSGLTGVSFDSSNNSLWVADSITDQAYDFSTSGVLLSQFSVGLDPDAGIAVVPSSEPEPATGMLFLFALTLLSVWKGWNKDGQPVINDVGSSQKNYTMERSPATLLHCAS